MSKHSLFPGLLLLLFSLNSIAQLPSQTLRGIIVDNASKAPIPFANIILLNTKPLLGTTADTAGNFKILNVPIGRYDVQVSFISYESSIIKEVQLTSAKEIFLTIPLKENSTLLGEFVVKPNINKEQALNTTSSVSARMLSVEEASRYAGGFDDPARLASSFAGVSSNIGNNGIVVRGNSPKSLQWKMEGVEIPNPNHFADLSAFGGGGLTALSTKVLANSDFFTGAFPAEYGNALSGVFDIFMRTGNNQKYEHSFQLGIIGIEASSEGPFKKGTSSSYLLNYRYSTLGLLAPVLPENGEGVSYQDISFKLNFVTKKSGVFSFWGIGLTDHSGQLAKTDSSKWVYDSDKESMNVNQFMGASGITHKYFFNKNISLNSIVAATVNGIDLSTKYLNNELLLIPSNKINNNNWNFSFSSYLNTKLNAKHSNKTGISVTRLKYDLLLQNSVSPASLPITIVDEEGNTTLISGYSNSTYNFNNRLTLNTGIIGQLFLLNTNYTIEPRIGLKWMLKHSQTLGLAYGLHSRIEKLNYYFTTNNSTGNELINKDLDFSKAHHFVISYDKNITDNIHFKAEVYYQYLFNVPVIADSSFSFINLQNEWFFDQKLENTGKGKNIGLDITIEQYLVKGLYYMITASVFDSKYTGGDGIWRDTRYNRNYLFNFLIGKEWQTGKSKQNTFGLNVRMSYQGGDHYSPVLLSESQAIKDVVYDEYNAFSKSLKPSFTTHFTVSYKINKKKTAQEFALKAINATNYKEFYGFQYNYIQNTVDEFREAILIPNLSYKIEF